MLADGPTNVCALTPVMALLVLCFSVGRIMIVLFSYKVDGVNVHGRIGRCFTRHETMRNSPLKW